MSSFDLDTMLTQATENRASDLHLRVGMAPMIRVDGDLAPLRDYEPITKDQIAFLVKESLTPEQVKAYSENKSVDLSRAVKGVARFRVSYFLQQGMMGGVFRRIPDKIPSLGELGAPAVLLEFCRRQRGLVLVTGPTGSGKSTTLAAVLDVINTERADHILTIEDPIEFVHHPKRCIVNQREIGRDAIDFAHALRGALRQDPDVILVGEMRDLETISTAITAAETGHLVFGTLHTSSADSTISRVIDVFPAEQQEQIRIMLASSLVGIVTQTLLPRSDGPGRVAAHEVLVANHAVRALIRKNDMAQARGIMQTQSQLGMQTMDRALAFLVHSGQVAEDEARERAILPSEFDQTLTTLRRGGTVAVPRLVQRHQGSMADRTAPGTSPVAGASAAAGARSGGSPAATRRAPSPTARPAGASMPAAGAPMPTAGASTGGIPMPPSPSAAAQARPGTRLPMPPAERPSSAPEAPAASTPMPKAGGAPPASALGNLLAGYDLPDEDEDLPVPTFN